MALITSQVANSQLGYQDIVKVVHGGDNAGTWMHEKLALKFAAWLSPRFEVWVFDRIQELLLQGHVAIRPTENTDQTERIEALERRLHDVELNMFKSLHHFACAFWEKEIVDEARRTAPHDMAAIHRYTASFTASVKKATENIH